MLGMILACLDPDPGSGSTDTTESGPKNWFRRLQIRALYVTPFHCAHSEAETAVFSYILYSENNLTVGVYLVIMYYTDTGHI